MRLVVLALLFVAFAASDLAVLDLYPIVLGFTASPDYGDQRIWLEERTFEVDFEMAPIAEDHLWEATVYAEKPITGAPPCEYSVAYKQNGNTHVIRYGGWGTESLLDYDTMFLTSSSVLWVKGTEVPNDASHLVYTIKNCFLGRYVTRMQFEAWNGQAYLLDLSGTLHTRAGWGDQTTRFATYDFSVYETYLQPMMRDSSLYQPSAGYWTGEMYLDWSAFTSLNQPILELWYYKGPYDDSSTTYFYFCDWAMGTTNCAQQYMYTNYNSYAYHYYEYYESGFVRIFFDIKAAINYGTGSRPYGDDPYSTLYIYNDYESYGLDAFAPYARIWDMNPDSSSPRYSVSPMLMDLSSATVSGDCYTDTYYDSETLEYDGPGFHEFTCGNDDGATITWTLPTAISTLENPFMYWYEWSEWPGYYQVQYEIFGPDAVSIHKTDLAPGYYSELYGWDLQIQLGAASYSGGEQFQAVMQADGMYFMGVAPTYTAYHDMCNPTNPCQNLGECHNYYWSYVCICPLGWEGMNCTESTSDCGTNSCLNGGTCVDQLNNYTCACPPEWTGSRCEVLVNDCPQDMCLNDGVCVKGMSGRFTCDCTGTGFSGMWCEHEDNNCNLDPFACKNGGTCVSGPNTGFTYTCSCVGGFTGTWCEVSPACSPNPCLNGGWCEEEAGAAACTCPTNYFGDFCEDMILDYEKDCRYAGECVNGGTCVVNGSGDYRCDCGLMSGWTGTWCEVPAQCSPNPCLNEGSCQLVNGAPLCTCSGNYFGDFCEDTLETASLDCRYAGSCQNGGTCANNAGVHRCSCTSDWTGDWCEISTQCEPNPCLNNGHCTFVNGASVCTCTGTYFGDFCENTLAELELDCRFNGGCVNSGVCNDNANPGVYRCVCDNLLWTGNRCETSLLCEPNPCQNNGVCILANGAPVCMCTANYFGDMCDQTITDLEMDCRFGTCENGGVCNDNAVSGQYRCVCPTGWNGTWCEMSAMCNPNPCQNSGMCYVANGSVKCNCPGSYFGDFCQDTLSDFAKDCRFAGACQNGGNCNDNLTPGDYRCVCTAGWQGTFCDESTLCAVNPCENGGSCYVANNVAQCLCPGNYYGVHCQNTLADHFGDCGQPCENGGNCVNVVGVGYQCACDPNWTGEYCDTPVVCFGTNNPCLNDGQCQRGANGAAICVCPGTFVGANCQWNLMDFFTQNFQALEVDCRFGSPCQNDGQCVQAKNGAWGCQCAAGWFGDVCDVPAGCSPNPCENNGRCMVDSTGSVMCFCPAGTIGDNCQWQLADFIKPDCRFQHCWNGGSCALVKGAYSCSCPSGWGGDWCEVAAACDPNPCMNGGQCNWDGTQAVCACAGDHFGPTCEEENLAPRVVAIESAVDRLERINNVPKNN